MRAVRLLLAAQLVWSAAAFMRTPALQLPSRAQGSRQALRMQAESYDYDVIIVG
jgi:hypothetical protein